MFSTHSHRASTPTCVRVYVQRVRSITSYTAFSLTGGCGGTIPSPHRPGRGSAPSAKCSWLPETATAACVRTCLCCGHGLTGSSCLWLFLHVIRALPVLLWYLLLLLAVYARFGLLLLALPVFGVHFGWPVPVVAAAGSADLAAAAAATASGAVCASLAAGGGGGGGVVAC